MTKKFLDLVSHGVDVEDAKNIEAGKLELAEQITEEVPVDDDDDFAEIIDTSIPIA